MELTYDDHGVLREVVTWSEARDRGQRYYFTGRPCKHGHVALRVVESGTCYECMKQHVRNWQARNPRADRKQSHTGDVCP